MTTLLISHPSSLRHVTPPGHPERVDRIRVVEQALEEERFAILQRVEAPEGTLAQVGLCHPAAYAQAIVEVAPQDGMVQIEADTIMSPGTLAAALHGVGAAVHAVDEVMTGRAANAFSAMRPMLPGLHWVSAPAEPEGYARALYANLRELDATHSDVIVAESPPQRSEWLAVLDRLTRAAAGSAGIEAP